MKRIREEGRVPLGPALPLSTPFVINVDPASACNFKCQFCFHSKETPFKKGVMPWDLYKEIVRDIGNFGHRIKTLRLYAFGEPLVNKRFPDMVRFAKDKQISGDIDTTTNGSLLSPKLNLEIVSSGLDRINISVVGVNRDQYKEFSNCDLDFEKYVDNISHFFHNRGKCVVFIKINGDVISKEDEQRFLAIFTPISDGIAVERVMNCWYGVEMDGIKNNEAVGVYGQPLTHVDVCPYIFYSFCVNFDGVVSACFLDWNRKLVVGNIYDDSLVDVWNGPELRRMRKIMLLKQRKKMAICGNCHQLIAGQPENIDSLAPTLLEKMYGLSNMPIG